MDPKPSRSRMASCSGWSARIGTWEQASHGTARSGARGSSFRRKSGVPCYAQEDPESEASFQEGQGGGCPRGCQLSSALRGWYLAFPQRFGHWRYGGHVHGAFQDQAKAEEQDRLKALDASIANLEKARTIANERWRPGHVPASSQEVCRRWGILDFREAVSMQRLRLAARLVNASPSLMALLQSDAGRAWKAELFCDIELLRQEQGPQLVEVEGLSDFEKLWCDFPQAWKLLVSSCQRKLVERRQRSEPPRFAPVPILPTFGCDECDAVYFKLRALRSHQMKAHQRRREARRYVLDSVWPVCKADFRSRPRVIQHLEVGAKRCVLAFKSGTLVPFSDDAVAAADRQDCAHRRQCKREGRSHLAGPPMLRGGAGGQ